MILINYFTFNFSNSQSVPGQLFGFGRKFGCRYFSCFCQSLLFYTHSWCHHCGLIYWEIQDNILLIYCLRSWEYCLVTCKCWTNSFTSNRHVIMIIICPSIILGCPKWPHKIQLWLRPRASILPGFFSRFFHWRLQRKLFLTLHEWKQPEDLFGHLQYSNTLRLFEFMFFKFFNF